VIPYNAENQSYPKLERRIETTYVVWSNANNKNSLYDFYIKAFRWASDRLSKHQSDIIAFVSNGYWLDGNTMDGFRKCLEESSPAFMSSTCAAISVPAGKRRVGKTKKSLVPTSGRP